MRLSSYSGTQNKFTGNTKKVEVDLISSDVPSTWPTTGEDIPGLGAQYELLPGSTIYVVNDAALYMMNEEGEWKEQ